MFIWVYVRVCFRQVCNESWEMLPPSISPPDLGTDGNEAGISNINHILYEAWNYFMGLFGPRWLFYYYFHHPKLVLSYDTSRCYLLPASVFVWLSEPQQSVVERGRSSILLLSWEEKLCLHTAVTRETWVFSLVSYWLYQWYIYIYCGYVCLSVCLILNPLKLIFVLSVYMSVSLCISVFLPVFICLFACLIISYMTTISHPKMAWPNSASVKMLFIICRYLYLLIITMYLSLESSLGKEK